MTTTRTTPDAGINRGWRNGRQLSPPVHALLLVDSETVGAGSHLETLASTKVHVRWLLLLQERTQ